MKITEIDPYKLIPYENNPRKNDKAVPYVKESIRQFGFKQPIVIDKNKVVICGHTRLKAALELGLDKVPCITADDLTEEQIKAYRLADNKVAEEADWDIELLDFELESIFDIDMEDFGFEFNTEYDHKQFAETTQDRVNNIENLGKGQFKGEGYYDIPIIEPVYELPEIKEWIGFNYVLSDDNPEGKAVHFFIDDYQFERIWNNPEKYVEKLKQYVCVASPDFSPYGDMPNILQIYNHYRKHWVAAYLQQNGVTVIPTIRCSTDPRSMDWYLDGEPKEGIVIISSMWTSKEETKKAFMDEYSVMYKKLNPKKVFLYGNELELPGNIEHIKSFTDMRWEK